MMGKIKIIVILHSKLFFVLTYQARNILKWALALHHKNYWHKSYAVFFLCFRGMVAGPFKREKLARVGAKRGKLLT